jgi:4-amino-4-deoxy-L-arabinose transferase-like glycosyltransferase
VLLVVAFLLRVYHLLEMFPILVDESIYLRWAEIIDHQGQWFISLLDGKQPLQYWLLTVLRKVSDGDPLLAARLLSVVVGLLSTVALFALGKRLAGERAGLIAAGLYACLPYALLYDRLAYTEAFVNFFGILIAYASIACFDRGGGSWRGTLAAGLALGLGLFTKPNYSTNQKESFLDGQINLSLVGSK